MIVLGISAFADAAAAIVQGGSVIAAVEEERMNRIKHYEGMPWLAIKESLDLASLTLNDIDIVAVSWNPLKGWTTRLSTTALSLLHSKDAFFSKIHRGNGYISACLEILKLKKSLVGRFGPSRGDLKINFMDHHLAHAASAFLPSSFECADIIVADGVGESATLSFYSGEGSCLQRIGNINFPHSLGHLYASITGFLGFKMTCDEGKVMALAGFGQDRYHDLLRKVLRQDWKRRDIFLDTGLLDYHTARNGRFSSSWCALTGMQPRQPGEPLRSQHQDLACSLQNCIEEAVVGIIRKRFLNSSNRPLCAAGGLFLNSVLNGRILGHVNHRFFVQPAAGDNGGAMGAGLFVSASQKANFQREPLKNVYLGRKYTTIELQQALAGDSNALSLGDELYSRVAALIVQGYTVGWFQGRMEFGPRALGNRSILANPALPEIKETLNAKVKQRESFRPFAASVIWEEASRYFEDVLESPFMLKVFRFLTEYRQTFPAVTHVDYSCRLQTVTLTQNERLYNLLCEIRKLTGYGLVLNTSLNVSGDPIVNTPFQALEVLRKSELDFLVVGDFLTSRRMMTR